TPCKSTAFRNGPASDRERLTAATGRRGIRVLDDETRALEPLLIIDFSPRQILVAHRVDYETHTLTFDDGVIFSQILVEGETILKPGATTARDEDAQLEARIPLFIDQTLHLARGPLTELDGGGREGFDTHLVLPARNARLLR